MKKDDMLSHFSTTLERDGRTDRIAMSLYINIARQHCCAGARYKSGVWLSCALFPANWLSFTVEVDQYVKNIFDILPISIYPYHIDTLDISFSGMSISYR